ncbi:MAG: WG repeat-containing protein [Culturomica sp.]|jgi:hypothetical protein|nr:WG repeat-containing protein [Culturomica sp.]
MKAKLLLAWRILVAMGMIAVIFVVVLLTYEYMKDKRIDRVNDYYYIPSSYSDSYQFEWHENKVRLQDIQTGEYLTPPLKNIYDNSRIKDTLTVFFQGDKRGFLDVYTGEIVIPAKYERAWVFSEGFGGVVKDNKLGFINKSGEIVIPCQFRWKTNADFHPDFLFKNGYCAVFDLVGKWGIINTQGDWVIKPQYDNVERTYNGYYLTLNDNKCGLLDSDLQEIFPVGYDWIEPTTEGIIVRSENSQMLYAYDGKTVIQPFVYNDLSDIYYNSGKVNESGEDIYIKSDYMTFTIGDKVGLMNESGKIVVPAIYQDIRAIGNELFSCRVAGYGYSITINCKGEAITQ